MFVLVIKKIRRELKREEEKGRGRGAEVEESGV